MTLESVLANLENDIETLSERVDALEVQMNGATKLIAEMHLDLHAHLSGEDEDLTTRWSGSSPE
jgi:chaperonin cofactor prefoldin